MKKQKKIAIVKFTVISLIIALGLIFSFISFDGYAGFINASERGLELDGGVYANYTITKRDDVTDEKFEEDFDSTFLKIKSLIEQKGYQDAKIYKTSDKRLRIESPEMSDVKNILSQIGEGDFKIRTSGSSSAEVKLTGRDVLFAVATTSDYGNWGTYIQFTDEGSTIISELTASATSSSNVYLYFYRGDTTSYFFSLPVSSKVDSGFLFISSQSGMTQQNAVDLAVNVSCGSMPTILQIEGGVKTIFGIDGATLGLSIAAGVAIVFTLILLALIYRELGLMGCLSILFYAAAMMFLIQTIPVLMLTSASVGGILVGLALIAGFNIIIFEKIKEEYSIGKKLSVSMKTGYKRSINLIADISGGIALISLVIYLISAGTIKSFAIGLLVGSLVACFSSLLITWQLIEAYRVFNKDNARRVNFTREENINEIE
jgi:preprotein translocase subunit SecD